MPCFVCEKCGCIENTAIGHYWSRTKIFFKEGSLSPELVGKPLCIECTPLFYNDRSPSGGGKWHGLFAKEHWSVHYKEKPLGTF
jgi:hypothetical protein